MQHFFRKTILYYSFIPFDYGYIRNENDYFYPARFEFSRVQKFQRIDRFKKKQKR